MNSQEKAKLEAAGWTVGSAKDFLALSDAEAAYAVALGEKLRTARCDPCSSPHRRPMQCDLALRIVLR